jgi:heme A synthase
MRNWARILLFYTLMVILWGAWVRHTGSGAGCGDHWPLCDGEVIPRAPELETIIEFTHRAMSGIYGFVVLGLFVGAIRFYPKKHSVRFWAGFSMIFTIIEALLGALLVKRGLVVDNDSVERALVMGVHLINTFILLSGVTMLERSLSEGVKKWKINLSPRAWFLGVGWLVVGAFGAIASLGNTLFPSSSISQGLMDDFSSTSHFLVQLRVYHPVLAITMGLVTALLSYLALESKEGVFHRALILGILVNLTVGFLNIFLHAPTYLALAHLLLADVIWILLTRAHFFRQH